MHHFPTSFTLSTIWQESNRCRKWNRAPIIQSRQIKVINTEFEHVLRTPQRRNRSHFVGKKSWNHCRWKKRGQAFVGKAFCCKNYEIIKVSWMVNGQKNSIFKTKKIKIVLNLKPSNYNGFLSNTQMLAHIPNEWGVPSTTTLHKWTKTHKTAAGGLVRYPRFAPLSLFRSHQPLSANIMQLTREKKKKSGERRPVGIVCGVSLWSSLGLRYPREVYEEHWANSK